MMELDGPRLVVHHGPAPEPPATTLPGVGAVEGSPPMPGATPSETIDIASLRQRYTSIAAALATAPAPEERAALKGDIVALFRDASAAAASMAAFKVAVKGLADTWKRGGGAAIPVPHTGHSQRVDHLGASTFVEKGWSKLSLGDAAGAETALRRALELAPGDNHAEALLGWAQMLQEQYDSALLTLHTVLMRDPNHALARTNVGYICLRKKIYGEAIEHLSRAIRDDSDRKATLYAHLYLGMVYREREMYDDAELFFQRALELGPNLIQAWYELGRARWFAGRRDAALGAWQQGVSANKFNPWGKRCGETIALAGQGGAPPRDG
jgi:tetratricopeptide (TPR) repeat protein